MDRLMTNKNGLYEIIEEPGDGTRYSFLIQVKDEFVVVQKDMYAQNVGPKQPIFLHRDMVGAINKKLTGNGHKDVGKILDFMEAGQISFELRESNPYTVASIYRCAAEAIRLWHKDTSYIYNGDITKAIANLAARSINNQQFLDAIYEFLSEADARELCSRWEFID